MFNLQASNLMIMSGILCTFIGVAYGLSDFDVGNINDENLGRLITGIKTAFIPSAVAMALALVWKGIFPSIFSRFFDRGQSEKTRDCTIDDLVRNQNEIQNCLTQALMQKDSLLLESLEHIRKEIVIGFRDMGNEFKTFADKVASDNSEKLIQALQEVIRDFNAKINEQFGENFKELNYAVGNLLEWQNHYAQELSKKIVFFDSLQKGLDEQVRGYQNVVECSKSFTDYVQKFDLLMEDYALKQQEITQSVHLLSDLSNNLKESIPSVVHRVDEVTQTSQRLIKEMESHYVKLIDQFNNYHEKMSDEINEISQKIKNQTDVLHNSLETELNNSLNSLGSQLASLSNKFVEDYTPLTNRLREVLEIANRLSK